MSGEGLSPAFSWGAGRRAIQSGEPVIVDFGTSVFGYQTDQTRTFCIGSAPEWLLEAHAAVLAVHRRMVDALRPGAVSGDVFALGEAEACRVGLDGYLGREGSRCRFVGHGIGTETVEPPVIAEGSKAVFERSFTIALEPKAVVGERGGVGVEDTLVLEEGGARPLSAIPLELIRI
jgi:Xaa-Pro aminopeptidase